MARKKQEEESGGNWMDTYGDMVTLLMTFFIALYSMSSMVEERWESLVVAFSNGNGEKVDQIVFTNSPEGDGNGLLNNNGDSNGEQIGIMPGNPEDINSVLNSSLDQLYDNIMTYVDENDMANSIIVSQFDENGQAAGENGEEGQPGESGGNPGETQGQTEGQPGEDGKEQGSEPTNNVYIKFSNNVLFQPDESTLRSESYPTLQFLGDCLKSVQDDIALVIIKGHTAISPTSVVDSRILSAERASKISNYFESNCALPSTLLLPLGLAGDYPIASNDTEAGREQNRRVEVVIISKKSALGQNKELLSAFGASFNSGIGDLSTVVGE